MRFFVWVDDILVLTKAIAEAELSKTLMSAAARRHPAGPFEFKRLLVRRVQDGFDFLGTHFRKRRGHAMARPADKNLREFRAEVFARRLTLLLTGAGLDKDEVYVRAWCRSFGYWPLADAFQELHLSALRHALSRSQAPQINRATELR